MILILNLLQITICGEKENSKEKNGGEETHIEGWKDTRRMEIRWGKGIKNGAETEIKRLKRWNGKE